jgi:thiamine biosynthesis protein ThiS
MILIGERTIPWREGLTLSALLEQLADGHHYAVVKLNGKLVSRPHFHTTPVPDGAEVVPIPIVAGG